MGAALTEARTCIGGSCHAAAIVCSACNDPTTRLLKFEFSQSVLFVHYACFKRMQLP